MDNMRIFESHCHIDDRSFADDLDAVVQRARSAQVMAMMVVGTDGPSSRRAVAIADRYPDVYAAVGLHPHDAKACSENLVADLKSLARHAKVRAWGEAGLDFNRMFSPQKDQEDWFIRQIEIAETLRINMNTVYSRLKVIKKSLHRYIDSRVGRTHEGGLYE